MNDDVRLGRRFEYGLHELAPTRAPDRLRTQVKTETSRVRPRPRWLAIIKEPPMRTNSHLAVGSPAMRVAVTMAATLLAAVMLVGATFAGSQILAADGTIVVDQSGGGDFTTITAAVADAEDGDEVLVRPGTYTEAVVIDKDITVRGDGPVEDIVVMAPEDGPEAMTHSDVTGEPYAVLLSESSGGLSGLTFRGEPSSVIVSGGSPTVEGNVFDDVAWPFPERGTTQDGGSITVNAGSTAHIVGNVLVDGGTISVFGEASPVIESNRLQDGPHIYLREVGADTIVRGNEIIGALDRGIAVSSPGAFLIEDNRISDTPVLGIRVGRNSGATGFEPVVRNNTIEGANIGIEVRRGAAPHIEGNTLSGNRDGINATNASGTYLNNVITGNDRGLVLSDESPIIDGNTIRDNEVGLFAFGSETTPVMTGNTICDNETNVTLGDTVPPLEYDDSNEICEDTPAE